MIYIIYNIYIYIYVIPGLSRKLEVLTEMEKSSLWPFYGH